MRTLRRMITPVMFLVISSAFAHADEISYTFTGEGGDLGTDWTLVDPSGYIPDDTNVLDLLTSSTDFIEFGVDYGPLIGIGDAGEQSGNSVCTNAGTPCFEINMAINNPFGSGAYLIPYFFPGNDGTTGTFTNIQNGLSTLTITDLGPTPVPEPSSLLLVSTLLLGLGGTFKRRFVS